MRDRFSTPPVGRTFNFLSVAKDVEGSFLSIHVSWLGTNPADGYALHSSIAGVGTGPVGVDVGVLVGNGVFVAVGVFVGTVVGVLVGDDVGVLVGIWVGVDVAVFVGVDVGIGVGGGGGGKGVGVILVLVGFGRLVGVDVGLSVFVVAVAGGSGVFVTVLLKDGEFVGNGVTVSCGRMSVPFSFGVAVAAPVVGRAVGKTGWLEIDGVGDGEGGLATGCGEPATWFVELGAVGTGVSSD